MSDETVRRALKATGTNGKRAAHGIISPGLGYARQTNAATG